MRYPLEKLALSMPASCSRNEFMGSTIAALPKDTQKSQYILQEYFIPYDQLNLFIEQLRTIVKKHKVDLVNVSARHVRGNDESLLSWSEQDSCALVLYIGQPCNDRAYDKAVTWTRKIIDAALSNGGSFYLPYHYIATPEQVGCAYKNVWKFLELKEKYDPNGVFKNKMYEHYLRSYSS